MSHRVVYQWLHNLDWRRGGMSESVYMVGAIELTHDMSVRKMTYDVRVLVRELFDDFFLQQSDLDLL